MALFLEPTKCPRCERKFLSFEGLKVHMKRSHDVELISVRPLLQEQEEAENGSPFYEGQWVEVVENGRRLCKAFVTGAGAVSTKLEILGSLYTPGMVYIPLEKEIRNEFIHPISNQLDKQDQRMLQEYFTELALETKDFDWFYSLTTKN